MYNELAAYIREMYDRPDGFIPMHEPRFIGNEKKYLEQCIDTTFVSSVGEFVDRFAKMMCEMTGAAYAIPVSNGTAALHLSLVGAGVKQDDEVLTQSLTFIATCNAIVYEKATPHFIDIDADTLGMSPEKLKDRLEEIAEMRNGECFNRETGKRIKACVPMHTFGLPLRIDEIAEICNEYNIVLIEDAAESLGSTYKGQHTGRFGKLGAISFNGNKIATSGGGGAILTDDIELGKHLHHLSTQAKIPHTYNYEHDYIGYNYRMPNINAALICAQLEQLHRFVEDKRQIHEAYKQFFQEIDDIDLLDEIGQANSNYWLNAIQVESKEKKVEFLENLNAAGIMCRPVWKLLHTLPMFSQCPKGNLSNSTEAEDKTINITSSSRLNG
ncbi:MAG: LegC family aminotransferase [Crocinitomicaceae bacterium]|nr:LegC family aminotransferase [Crocinitomicaceae bacterium]